MTARWKNRENGPYANNSAFMTEQWKDRINGPYANQSKKVSESNKARWADRENGPMANQPKKMSQIMTARWQDRENGPMANSSKKMSETKIARSEKIPEDNPGTRSAVRYENATAYDDDSKYRFQIGRDGDIFEITKWITGRSKVGPRARDLSTALDFIGLKKPATLEPPVATIARPYLKSTNLPSHYGRTRTLTDNATSDFGRKLLASDIFEKDRPVYEPKEVKTLFGLGPSDDSSQFSKKIRT